jgi:hypothetical protein
VSRVRRADSIQERPSDGEEGEKVETMVQGGHPDAEDHVREKMKTSVVARKLKRTPGATRQKARALGVKLAESQRKGKA